MALPRVFVVRIWLQLSGLQVWLSSLQLRLSGLRLRLWTRGFRLWPWAKLPAPTPAGLLFPIPPISHPHSRALPHVIFAVRWGRTRKMPQRGAGASRQWMENGSLIADVLM